MFFDIDEFCQQFEPRWKQHLITDGTVQRNRERTLALSEMMTILVLFHVAGYRTFKQFYTEFVCRHLRSEFPALVSYSRFVQLEGETLLPLAAAYLQTRAGNCTGISFVDATKLVVCENLRMRATQTVCRHRGTRQNLDRVVFWFQTAFNRQRLRRIAVMAGGCRETATTANP